jgi:hypothetical protein
MAAFLWRVASHDHRAASAVPHEIAAKSRRALLELSGIAVRLFQGDLVSV